MYVGIREMRISRLLKRMVEHSSLWQYLRLFLLLIQYVQLSVYFIENVEKFQGSISCQEPAALHAQHIYEFVLSHINFVH